MKTFLAYPVIRGLITILFWCLVLALAYYMYLLLVDFIFAFWKK